MAEGPGGGRKAVSWPPVRPATPRTAATHTRAGSVGISWRSAAGRHAEGDFGSWELWEPWEVGGGPRKKRKREQGPTGRGT